MQEAQVEKGSIFEIKIHDMSSEGQGIGRVCREGKAEGKGLVVFVPDTVPGDLAKVEITGVKKNYALSRLIEIKQPSEDRVFEGCPYRDRETVSELTGVEGAKPCGGCAFGSISYEKQLELKQKQVTDKLTRLAGADPEKVREIAGMDPGLCFRYRNKAVMPISTGGLITRKGGIAEPVHEPRIGFRPAGSQEVIDCRDCRLQAPPAMAAAEAGRRFMVEDNITSYDKRRDKGLMKSMTVRTASGTGEVMVIYEINGKGIPNGGKLVEMLDDAIYEEGVKVSGDEESPAFALESVILKSVKGNKSRTEVLAGRSTITDTVEIEGRGRLRFEISPDSFYQVNPMQMEKLYGIVRDFVERLADSGGKNSKPVILDIYCGIGTIGLCLADMAEHVHGIEIMKDAVLDANRNATINGIVNATYACGKAEELIPAWLADGNSADIAVLDPPRAGCRPELLSAIAKAEIPHIIYVSCDPATLARDVKILTSGEQEGCTYEFVEAVPVDMFPHTGHVETVVLLSRKAD